MVSMILRFVAVGKSVGVGVVEQGVVAVSPWESLVPDAHVIVLDEFGTRLSVVSLVAQVGVHHAESYSGQCHDEAQPLPQLIAATLKGPRGYKYWLHNSFNHLFYLISLILT